MLKLAVIGARGIGKYHVREFFTKEADVISILSRTKESSELTAKMLRENFGINVKPYHNLEEMLQKEEIDAVSICTNPETHGYFIKKCLEKGMHVLCEKPLVAEQNYRNYLKSVALLNLAKNKGKILTVNTQWPAVLEFFGDRIKLPLKKLNIYMQSGSRGKEMLLDHLPHANSILTRLIKDGILENPVINLRNEKEVYLSFEYISKGGKSCKARYNFRYNPERPRGVEFVFNGNRFVRKVNENYQQSFINRNEEIPIPDPLGESIQRFIDSIMDKKKNPLISEEGILDSAKITDAILQKYDKA